MNDENMFEKDFLIPHTHLKKTNQNRATNYKVSHPTALGQCESRRSRSSIIHGPSNISSNDLLGLQQNQGLLQTVIRFG